MGIMSIKNLWNMDTLTDLIMGKCAHFYPPKGVET